jgi:hypothetical protein
MRTRQAIRTKPKHRTWESGVRMEIEKSYFTLPEILERWSMSEADLVYLAENDQLRLSIRVFGWIWSSATTRSRPRASDSRFPWSRAYFNGLLDLHAHDVFQLFRWRGEAQQLSHAAADYALLLGMPSRSPCALRDLLLRREERDRFEAETGSRRRGCRPTRAAFHASADYQEVRCNGALPAGPIQAEVVRALHEAALKASRGRAARRSSPPPARKASRCPMSSSRRRTGAC